MAAPSRDVEAVGKDVHEHEECPKDNLYNDSTAVVDHAAERSLCFKFDIRILPVLAVMCKNHALMEISRLLNHADAIINRPIQCP